MAGFRVSIPYLFGGLFTATPPIATEGQTVALQSDINGNLKVTVVGGSASNPAASPTGSAVPADASYTGVNVGGILQGVTGFTLTNSTPAAVAIVDANGNQITSFGGGTQYADGTTQATPTGTVALGKNPSNILHSLALDASGNLEVVVNASLPAGTNVIGHVIVDSGSITVSGSVSVSNFPATQNVAGTTADGTTTETNFLVVGGETNDATAQYQPIPLGAGGRSVIVEGTAAALAAVVGNPVLVAGADGAGNVQYLPVTANGATAGGRLVQVGGEDATTSKAQVLITVNGALVTAIQAADGDNQSNTLSPVFLADTNGTIGALVVYPHVLNSIGGWDRIREGGALGSGSVFVSIGDSLGSGAFTAVKPASTASLATDPALVVTISPNTVSVPVTSASTLVVKDVSNNINNELVVSDSGGMGDTNRQMLLELRALKYAVIAMANLRPSDFEAESFDDLAIA